MTPVREVLRQLGQCFVLGMAFGPVWSLLHPLSRRIPALWQILCAAVLSIFWAQAVFGICRADPRAGLLLGAWAGFFLWNRTAGPAAEALFSGFWNLFAQWNRGLSRLFRCIFHKIANFRKYLFPSRRK